MTDEREECVIELRITMAKQYGLWNGTINGKTIRPEEYLVVRSLPSRPEHYVTRSVTLSATLHEPLDDLAKTMLDMYQRRGIIESWEEKVEIIEAE